MPGLTTRAFGPAGPAADRWARLYAALSALLILGPLLGPGQWLWRDAVTTPRPFLTDSALGLGDGAPRAVPQDWLLAGLGPVIDPGIVARIVTAAALTAAGWGAIALVRTFAPPAGGVGVFAATTVALWNPFVGERLLQGHWSLLTGYAALPWLLVAAHRMRSRRAAVRRAGWALTALAAAAAGLTPTGSVLAGIVAVTAALCPGPRRLGRAAGTAGLWLLTAVPWLTAAVIGEAGATGASGIDAFAARAEPALGTLGALAGLGGIWNGDAVPLTRTTVIGALATAVLLVIVAAGAPALWRRRRDPLISLAAILAVLGVLGPALAATGPGLVVLEFVVDTVPGAGLLRDGQKWVALAVPGYLLAVGFGAARITGALRDRYPGRVSVPAAGATLCAVLLVLSADLAWGVGGRLAPYRYPADWAEVSAQVSGEEGDVAVVPAGSFRRFPDLDPVALDPAPRMLPAEVLQTGDLVVRMPEAGEVTVSGEGTRAAQVEQLLLAGAPPSALAARGVAWVLEEKTSPGPRGDAERTLAGAFPVFVGEDLALYRIADPAPAPRATSAERTAAHTAHGVWAAVLLLGAAGVAVTGRAVRRRTGA